MKEKKTTTIKLIDFLYKNNSLVCLHVSDDEKTELRSIANYIDKILKGYNLNARDVHIINHYVYCALEILSSYSDSDSDKELSIRHIEFLLKTAKGKLTEYSYKILNAMIIAINQGGLKECITYDNHRLCRKYFFIDYPNATMNIYLYAIDKQIISSKKSRPKDIMDEFFLLRLGLLLEFEYLRYRSHEFYFSFEEYTYENLIKYYTDADDIGKKMLADKGQNFTIPKFIKTINLINSDFIRHFEAINNIIEFNTQDSNNFNYIIKIATKVFKIFIFENSIINKSTDILSLLGVLEVKKLQKKLSSAIYNEYGENLCMYASDILSEHGIFLSAKTIYIRYAKHETSDFFYSIDFYNSVVTSVYNKKTPCHWITSPEINASTATYIKINTI